jgi:hypothetical protein
VLVSCVNVGSTLLCWMRRRRTFGSLSHTERVCLFCWYVQMEGNLRGAATTIELSGDDIEQLERELQLSLGSTSTSLSFSVASASHGAGCYDAFSYCIEVGALYTDTSTDANTGGNSFAIANSEVGLWLNAFCSAYASAYAQACAFTKIDGDIKVGSITQNGYKEVSLAVSLKTATKTLAYASSAASAASWANAEAYSYTDTAAYCTAVKNKSPFCGSGFAGTDLTQVASASASAFGAASSLATSGSVTKQGLAVSARGSSLDYINGYLAAYAKSWSYANAFSIASTYARAFTSPTRRSPRSVWESTGKLALTASSKEKGSANRLRMLLAPRPMPRALVMPQPCRPPLPWRSWKPQPRRKPRSIFRPILIARQSRF